MSEGTLTTKSAKNARAYAKDEGIANLDLIESLSQLVETVKLKFGNSNELGLKIEEKIKLASGIDTYQKHIEDLANDDWKISVLIDDLDIGWDNKERSNNLLPGLLSASQYLKAIHKNINVALLSGMIFTQ